MNRECRFPLRGGLREIMVKGREIGCGWGSEMSNMYKHGLCALACPKVHTLYTRVLTRCTLSSFSFTEAYVSLIVPPFGLSTYNAFLAVSLTCDLSQVVTNIVLSLSLRLSLTCDLSQIKSLIVVEPCSLSTLRLNPLCCCHVINILPPSSSFRSSLDRVDGALPSSIGCTRVLSYRS